MTQRIDPAVSDREFEPDAQHSGDAEAVVADAKLNYLRMMAMTLLSELNSLRETGCESGVIDLKAEVQHFESELIRSALYTTRGQQRRAARLLGTNATTLNTKLKKRKICIEESSMDNLVLPETMDEVERDGHLTFAEAMHRYEISLIRHALIQTGGNQSRAARLLGLATTTLNTKIKKLKIAVPKYTSAQPLFAPPSINHLHPFPNNPASPR